MKYTARYLDVNARKVITCHSMSPIEDRVCYAPARWELEIESRIKFDDVETGCWFHFKSAVCYLHAPDWLQHSAGKIVVHDIEHDWSK